MVRKTIVHCLLVACLPVVSIVAQESPSMSGFVLDRETGKPIPNVNIFYIPSAGGGTTTDSSGYFYLRLPSSGRTVVVFSHVAYERVSKDVNLDAQKTTQLQLLLTPKVIGLDGAVVTARKPFTLSESAERRARYTIGAEEISRVGEDDMERTLRYLLPDVVLPLYQRMTREGNDFTLYIDGDWRESIFLDDVDPRSVKRVLVWGMHGIDGRIDVAPVNLPLRRGKYIVLVETKQQR